MAIEQPPPGWKPIPDPTTLTTDAVERSERHLTELFNTKLSATEARIDQLKDSFDRALVSQRSSFNLIVSLLSVGIAVVIAAVTVVAFLKVTP